MKAIFEQLFDATVRMDRVIFLAGAMGGGDALPDDLDSFLDEDFEVIRECLGPLPDWLEGEIDSGRHCRGEAFSEWTADEEMFGFIVQFATPVMTPIGKGSRSYSWGYYNTTWLYGNTIEEVVEKGLKWAESRRESEIAKAKAQKTDSTIGKRED